MSESENSFESAKDKEFEDEETEESSDDEPLVKKNGKSPKASPKKKPSPKKSPKKATKATKKSRGRPAKKQKGRVSFDLVPSESSEKVEEEYEVENIVGHREYNGKLLYKIRWVGYDAIHDTWESYGSLNCPDILESYNFKHNVVVPKTAQGKGKRKAPGKKSSPSKKRKSSVSSSEEDDVPYDEGSDAEYEVDRIVEMRTKKDGSREFLVHWKRWSSDYDTWEPEENLSCPDLIEKFMIKLENAKNSGVKELRENRKRTERFTLNTRDSGRRLSKRNNQKQRVQYFDNVASDADE